MPHQKIIREVNQRIKQSLQQPELTCLQLDSIPIRIFSKQLKSLLEEYPTIEYLTLNDCQLTSLENFPKLDNLAILELSNNQIQDDELFHLLKCSHISHLMIDENRLRNIEKISVLRQLPNLQQLQIAGNRIGDSDFYREELFDRIPHLKIIDCHDKYGNIAINSDTESQQSATDKKDQEENQQNLPPSLIQERKSLLNLLMDQSHDDPIQKQSLTENEHLQSQLNEKEQNKTVSSNSSLNQHQQYENNINLTGSKKIKPQQNQNQSHSNQDNALKHSKVSNKRTSLIEEEEEISPQLNFLNFKRLNSCDFQE